MSTQNTVINCTNGVREVANKFSLPEIQQCMDDQRNTLRNTCNVCMNNTDPMDTLARASYVRLLFDQGMSLNEAYRELGVKMRAWMEVSRS